MKKVITVLLTATFLLTALATTSCRKTEKDAESDTGITSFQTEPTDTATNDAGNNTESQTAGSPVGTDTPEAEDTATDPTGEVTGDGEAEEIFGMFAGSYLFSSGVGFWTTTMKLNGDGTFEGKFHDWDSAPNEDDYDAVECSSVFSGSFKNPQKINDYTYSFEIDHIDYEREPGTEEIVASEDNTGKETKTKVRYSEAYGLDHGTTTVYAYTVGAPVAELPESFVNWVTQTGDVGKDDDKLPCMGLYAVEPGYGWSGPRE
ncbi:MAG: hypothetical protein IKN50_03745 [Clostridia bacterium]|nr:hypothetical protein [Clostridia bacterium]MBR3639699.1 hypothetical protein [Clostridia bacterium]